MLYPKFQGLTVIPSKTANRELYDLGLDLFDACDILESGYDCSRSRRKKDVIERCVDKGRTTFKIVAAKSYNYSRGEDVWLIIHAGKFTRRRKRGGKDGGDKVS